MSLNLGRIAHRGDLRPVLVTFPAEEEGRTVLETVLGDISSLGYIGDFPPERRRAELERADVLLTWDMANELSGEDWTVLANRDAPDTAPLFVQLLNAGVDDVPLARLPPDVIVAGNVGGWAEPMAEHVLAMILALAKRLLVEQEQLRHGVFNETVPTRELRGTACAILGFGGIGQAVASLVRPLGVSILALNSTGTTSAPADFIGTLADLEHVLRASDTVVITLPLTAATRGLIGARELGSMHEDAILVNVARGPIVDEVALYHHLVSHPRFSAGLDVWWDEPSAGDRFHLVRPFLELPNVLGSPHNSGVVHGWIELGLQRAAENVRRYLLGQRFVGRVRRADYLDEPPTLERPPE